MTQQKNGVLISNQGQLGAIAIILRNGLLASLPLLRLIKERCTGTILVTFPIWRRCEKKQIIVVTSRYICQKKIYENFVKNYCSSCHCLWNIWPGKSWPDIRQEMIRLSDHPYAMANKKDKKLIGWSSVGNGRGPKTNEKDKRWSVDLIIRGQSQGAAQTNGGSMSLPGFPASGNPRILQMF